MIKFVFTFRIFPGFRAFLRNPGKRVLSTPLKKSILYINQSFEILGNNLHDPMELILGNPHELYTLETSLEYTIRADLP